jgi:hypothetical protein
MNGLLLFPWLEGQIRAVVHMGVTKTDIEKAYQIIKNCIQKIKKAKNENKN